MSHEKLVTAGDLRSARFGPGCGTKSGSQEKWLSHRQAELKDKDARHRIEAAEALGKMGPEAKTAVPALAELLRDEEADVRAVAGCVGRYWARRQNRRPGARRIAPGSSATGSGVRQLRPGADRSGGTTDSPGIAWGQGTQSFGRTLPSHLQKMGPAATAAIPALISALHDKEANVQGAAQSALALMGSEAQAAIPTVMELLPDKDSSVREQAISALGDIGCGAEAAKAALPALVELLRDEDGRVRAAAASAISDMAVAIAVGSWNLPPDRSVVSVYPAPAEAKAAIPHLIGSLQDSEPLVRKCAAGALGSMGPDARTAVPALIELLRDKDAEVRQATAWALGNIGPDAQSAIPALKNALQDSDELVRTTAEDSLKRIVGERM